MSRVVETMLKFAHTHKKSDLLSKIIKELIPEVLQMSKRKYATHVVRAMIAHSSPVDRAAIVKAFCGHCVKLLSHKVNFGSVETLEEVLSIFINEILFILLPDWKCGIGAVVCEV